MNFSLGPKSTSLFRSRGFPRLFSKIGSMAFLNLFISWPFQILSSDILIPSPYTNMPIYFNLTSQNMVPLEAPITHACQLSMYSLCSSINFSEIIFHVYFLLTKSLPPSPFVPPKSGFKIFFIAFSKAFSSIRGMDCASR